MSVCIFVFQQQQKIHFLCLNNDVHLADDKRKRKEQLLTQLIILLKVLSKQREPCCLCAGLPRARPNSQRLCLVCLGHCAIFFLLSLKTKYRRVIFQTVLYTQASECGMCVWAVLSQTPSKRVSMSEASIERGDSELLQFQRKTNIDIGGWKSFSTFTSHRGVCIICHNAVKCWIFVQRYQKPTRLKPCSC